MDRIDAVVIGAGVVGLAVARALAMAGKSVIVLEREGRFGTGTSSRNSEVIHAGIHYPHGSLKERLCIEGKHRLYAFCASHHVPHRRCGKLTFAADESERARLEFKIALQEWLRRIPDFDLAPGTRITYSPSGVIGPDKVPLVW